MQRTHYLFGILLLLVLPLREQPAAQARGKDALLPRLAAYLATYEQAFSRVVCDEHYTQRARVQNGWQTRQLRSEVAYIRTDRDDWRFFRDVLAVDGIELRDRDERLARLLGDPDHDPSVEARRITEESARYNIGGVERTLNVPTLALIFLRDANQDRSSFTIASRATPGGQGIVELRFEEKRSSRMIYTTDRAAAAGRVWVDPVEGTIHGTELRVVSQGTIATVDVTYTRNEKLGMLVPEVMTETYQTGGRRADRGARSFNRPANTAGVVLEGTAAYSGCRRFSVTTRVK